jgi:hypothetical protein
MFSREFLCLIGKYYLGEARAATNITIRQYIVIFSGTWSVYFNTGGPKNNLLLNVAIYPSSYYMPFPVNPLSGR